MINEIKTIAFELRTQLKIYEKNPKESKVNIRRRLLFSNDNEKSYEIKQLILISEKMMHVNEKAPHVSQIKKECFDLVQMLNSRKFVGKYGDEINERIMKALTRHSEPSARKYQA